MTKESKSHTIVPYLTYESIRRLFIVQEDLLWALENKKVKILEIIQLRGVSRQCTPLPSPDLIMYTAVVDVEFLVVELIKSSLIEYLW